LPAALVVEALIPYLGSSAGALDPLILFDSRELVLLSCL